MTYHHLVSRTVEDDGDLFKVKVYRSDRITSHHMVEVALYEKDKWLGIIPKTRRVTPWFDSKKLDEDQLPAAIERLKSDARSWWSSQKRVESWNMSEPEKS